MIEIKSTPQKRESSPQVSHLWMANGIMGNMEVGLISVERVTPATTYLVNGSSTTVDYLTELQRSLSARGIIRNCLYPCRRVLSFLSSLFYKETNGRNNRQYFLIKFGYMVRFIPVCSSYLLCHHHSSRISFIFRFYLPLLFSLLSVLFLPLQV